MDWRRFSVLLANLSGDAVTRLILENLPIEDPEMAISAIDKMWGIGGT